MTFEREEVVYTTDGPVFHHPFMCRWDRPAKEGEKVEWFEVSAPDEREAAVDFARSCDNSNPRPPFARAVVVRQPDGTEVKVRVTCRPVIEYTTYLL